MTKHLTKEDLQALHDRGPHHLRGAGAVGEHLVECDECRAAYQRICELPEDRSPLNLAWEGAEEFDEAHLDFEREFVAFVEGRLGGWELEVVEAHLAACRLCAEDVAALREVQSEERLRAAPPHAATDGATKNDRPSRWRRLLPTTHGVPHVSLLTKAAWAGVAALVIIAAAAAAMLLLTRRDEAPRQARQQEQTRTTPEQTNSPPQAVTATPQPATTPNPPPDKKDESAKTDEPLRAARDDSARRVDGVNEHDVLPDDLRAEMRDAARTGSMRKPQSILAALAAAPLTLRGGSEPNEEVFALDEPAGVVVVSPRPVLRWQPLAGAESYAVSVLDSDFNEVAQSGPLEATSWRIDRPLKRGRVYSWQVTATLGGRRVKSSSPPASPVKFKILDGRSNALVGRVKRNLDPLSLAVLYAKVGALDEAARELSRVNERSPSARSARMLLEQLRAWKRDQFPAPTRLNPAQ